MNRKAHRRAILAVVVLSAALAPATALADSATLAAPAGPVPEDLATQITISGQASAGLSLFAKSRVAGGAPCAAVYKDDTGTTLFSTGRVDPNFTKTTSITYNEPGPRQICIWLQTDFVASTAAFATTATITVRQPNTAFSITPPAGVRSGQATQLTVNFQAEAARRVYVRVKPAGGTGCAPVYKNDTGNALISGIDINGGPSTKTASFTPGSPGSYLLCGWVQEDFLDEVAELATQATYAVPRISTTTTVSVRRAYRAYTVSGAVSGLDSGTVTIQRRSGGQWRRLKTTSVSYGSYSTTIRPSKKMRVRVRFSGTSSYLPSTSRQATVKRVR